MTARKGRKKGAGAGAGAGETAAATAPPAAAGREPDYHWNGRPVFKCHAKPGCQYQRVDDLDAVVRHEGVHATPPEPEHDSVIVGTSGHPLKVGGR